MSEKKGLAAASASVEAGPTSKGQEWLNWLHACGGQPSRPPSSPGRTEAAWTALTLLARREGFTVERGNCAAADGFTTWRNRRIRISPDAQPAQAVIALAHQLGHVLLHGPIARLEPSGTVPCTGIRKVEADSVAYLAAAHVGIGATVITFPHVSSWAGTDPRARPVATIKAATTRILAATATITAHLDTARTASGQPRAPTRASKPRQATRISGPRVAGQRAVPLLPEGEHARVHHSALQFFRNQMPGSWVPGYLANRGISPAVQDHWLAGYAPAAWDALTRHLRTAGFPDSLIEAAGLARRSRRGTLIDTFRDRAMLPIRSAEGTIIAFIGRAPSNTGPSVPKYLNSPSTAVYDKGEALFGLWEAHDALASGARPVIVEGPLDAIAVSIAGNRKFTAVAPCGTAFTARHADALAHAADLHAVGVTVAFDPDEAGRRAAVRAYHLLVQCTEKLATVMLPAGQTPAQILADSGPAALARVLASHTRPLPDLVIDAEATRWASKLRYPEGQLSALRATAPLIAAMPTAHVARQVARLAVALRLDHATVTEAVTDALTALVAGQRNPAHRAGLRGPPLAAGRVAGQDSPRSAQQTTGNGAATMARPAGVKSANASQAQLPARPLPR